ncbi:endonuclease [bacterium]|nr:endonuclease [bacterium]
MKNIFLIIILALLTLTAYSAAPAGYYDSATGSGATLKTQLYNIINGHSSKSYDSLYTYYETTDNTGANTVWDMYSFKADGTADYYYFNDSTSSDKCGNYTGEGDCYNREHSVPASWFFDDKPMYTDLFMVYPTDGYVNNKRSNYPFGENNGTTWTSSNGSKVGSCTYPGYTGASFEPIDCYKGDFARTYFYTATRYEENTVVDQTSVDEWSSAMFNNTKFPCFETWALDMLREWHVADPVSQKEIDRNDAVYAIQGNRNPYIDHPDWVCVVWGGSCGDDITAPIFAGIEQAYATQTSGEVYLSWSEASDLSTPINYHIYIAESAGGQNFSSYDYTTAALNYTVTGLTDGITYYFVVRAEDSAAVPNEDDNTVELAVIPTDVNAAPAFAGVSEVTDVEDGGSIYITWDSAWDINTPITYNIYRSTTSSGQNFSSPINTTSSLNMTDTGRSIGQAYFYVVRATDSLGLEDTNTVELFAIPSLYVAPAELDVSGWKIVDRDQPRTYTIPADTIIKAGHYLIVARDATKSEFELEWGITLHADDVYLDDESSNDFVINGGEYYELLDDADITIDGPSPASLSSLANTNQRNNPGDSALLIASWTTSTYDNATPGSGAGTPSNAGVIINEYSDGSDYKYEYIELYYDGGGVTDTTPPVFAGIESVTDTQWGGELTLGWSTASDTSTPISYYIYISTASGGQDFGSPDYVTQELTYDVNGLNNGTEYFFVVRARDSKNNVSTNMQELSGIPTLVNDPPVFSGIENAVGDAADNEIVLSWSSATDSDTPLLYIIYRSTASSGQDFGSETYSTASLSFDDTVIVPGTTYYYVVRALDNRGAEDSNSVELAEMVFAAAPGFAGLESATSTGNNGEVSLSWSSASDDNTPISYRVFHSTQSGVYDFDLPLDSTEALSYLTSGLTNGVTYFFIVRAYDSFGLGDSNNAEHAAMPDYVNTAPTFAGLFSIAPDNVDIEIDLEWQSASDLDTPITYNIYRSTFSGGQDLSAPNASTLMSSYSDASISMGVTYYYIVRAEDSMGLEDENSVEGHAGIYFTPPIFSGITSAYGTGNPGENRIAWGTAIDSNDPVNYYVYRSTASSSQDFGSHLYFTTFLNWYDTGLINGTTYFYVVRARDAQGTFDDNAVELSATPYYNNSAPEFSGINSISSDESVPSISIGWNAAVDSDTPINYHIYRSPVSGGQNFSIPLDSTLSVIYEDSALTGGATYYYIVRAYDFLGVEDTNTVEAYAYIPSLTETDFTNVIIYPNPTSEEVNISGLPDATKISIYTVSGELLFSETSLVNSFHWDGKNGRFGVRSGIYLITLEKDGNVAVLRLAVIR